MKKIPPFCLALIFGSVLEGVIVVLALTFANFGRDMNPGNIFTDFVMVIHWPGVIAARLLQPVDSHEFDYTIILGITTVLWSVVAFIVTSLVRRFYGKRSKTA